MWTTSNNDISSTFPTSAFARIIIGVDGHFLFQNIMLPLPTSMDYGGKSFFIGGVSMNHI